MPDGTVPLKGLVEIDGKDVEPGTRVRMTAFDGEKLDARVVETRPVDPERLRKIRADIERLERAAEEEYQGWVREHQESAGKK